MIKYSACFSIAACAVVCLFTTAHAVSARADDVKFTTLYKFEAPAATTFTSALGSQPDTLPVVGAGRRHLRHDQSSAASMATA